jgi:hypothetical protein
VLEAWVKRNYDDPHFVTMAGSICERLDDERASCWEGLGAGLMEQLGMAVWANGDERILALPSVAEQCEHICEGLPETMERDAIEWCQDGAFRHYMNALTETLSDDAFLKEFPKFCEPTALHRDAHLLEHCHEAQVFGQSLW